MTTAGMAISLLISLSLLFSTAQIYRVNSLAAEVQDVADAVALAAENEVAEFMIAVRLCDSVVLSLSLLGMSSHGLGIVALCVPPISEVGVKLIEVGGKTLKARDAFAKRAAEGLNQVQRALPFIAAAQGAAVALANGQNRSCDYFAMGMLVPSQGAPIAAGGNAAEDDLERAVAEKQDELERAAAEAEQAAQEASKAKQRAFARDCGDNPSYCLYERASRLAGLGGRDNPLYRSVDTWSFSVPLARARAYYKARLAIEAPEGGSAEDGARSALRKRFYAYANEQLKRAYVHETADSFEASFPRFPRNTDQMRGTSLYTEVVYPVTRSIEGEAEASMMHAWPGCPQALDIVGYGSAQMLDEGGYETCPDCHFKVSLLGSVAAASTSIENGFEYHYDAISRAAEDYEKALGKARPLNKKVQRDAGDLFGKVLDAMKGAVSQRIDAEPPGAAGCIALVVSPPSPGVGTFDNPFVMGQTTLGARAAVSAATLVEDVTDEASVVGNVLNGFQESGSMLVGAGRLVLQCWSGILNAYGSGQQALMEGIESALNALPLVGASGLGTWAADALSEGLEDLGLQPAEDAPLKPVLVKSSAVAEAGKGDFSARYLKVKQQVLSVPASSTDPFVSLADRIEREAFDRLDSGEIEIARIDLPVGNLSFPLTVTLPPSIKEGATGLVEKATELLRLLNGSVSGLRAWG